MSKARYRVIGSYDTETSNIMVEGRHAAFACLYIYNDFSRIPLEEYEPGHPDEHIHLFRTSEAFVDHLCSNVINRHLDYIPIVCAYNLMFDMQTIMHRLSQMCGFEVCAQSATNVYTLDLVKDGRVYLRFWDTFHLERNGLAAMGNVAGVEKATGSWDYNLVRGQDTPLTDDEIHYATRDVQVIPAYLRYLIEANDHVSADMLGSRIITSTSIVRSMAASEIGERWYRNSKGKRVKLAFAWGKLCKQNMPPDFHIYGLRKACFRGGFTFTSANWASLPTENVASLDVTSMHHAFICGRYIPVRFSRASRAALQFAAERICETPIEHVLKRYHRPFDACMHVRIRFTNIRLRQGSVFEACGMGCIPASKFNSGANTSDVDLNEGARASEIHSRLSGWVDRAQAPVFAFSKLMRADVAVLHLTELELWNVSRVYEWDDMEVLLGEATVKQNPPPDYVTLQSNLLYERKNDMKAVLKTYEEGRDNAEPPASIPSSLRAQIVEGTAERRFLEAYYNATVKSMFNAIYGTQAQDVYKADYDVEEGNISIDRSTVCTEANFEERTPAHPKVLYTYGMRIVGGSRMHLVIALELLHEALGERVTPLGGDTDSIKLRCDADVTDDDLLGALAPLHEAVTAAIDTSQTRVRKLYPDIASGLSGVGCFEIEGCGGSTRYAQHMEAWNKARLSVDVSGQVHVTCAGLSRPRGLYTFEDYVAERLKEESFEEIAPDCLGYNVEVDNAICHSLQRTHPLVRDRIRCEVTDYTGRVCQVDDYEAICLYPASREIGDTSKGSNWDNVRYLRSIGRDVDVSMRMARLREGHAVMEREEDGILLME